ncbi:MAG TPA: hypothetical protein VFW65_38755 [Pseudonocardiaceae bacterium]|nr:hypothetical protein [Pseudonocardiaceae bacterium]
MTFAHSDGQIPSENGMCLGSGAPRVLTPDLWLHAGVNVVIVGGLAVMGVVLPWLTVPGAIVGLLIQPYLGTRRATRRGAGQAA